jgi:hypothetical protein
MPRITYRDVLAFAAFAIPCMVLPTVCIVGYVWHCAQYLI